jgi:hypothetical protein
MSKSGLFALAVIFGLLGIGSAYASGRIMCVLDTCLLVTEGSGILDARGISIDSGTSKVIQSSPVALFGIAGVCLLGALVKQDST